MGPTLIAYFVNIVHMFEKLGLDDGTDTPVGTKDIYSEGP